MPFRPRVASTVRGPGAWLSFRSTKRCLAPLPSPSSTRGTGPPNHDAGRRIGRLARLESTRNSGAHRVVPGSTLCLRCPSGILRARHNVQPGNPRGTPSRCGCPGHEASRRRAIGAVAALQSSTSRPRRWCDAGTPRRECVTADQKAGAPGRHHTRTAPRLPARPTASRTRDTSRSETDGQAGRSPPQCGTALPAGHGRARIGAVPAIMPP